MFYSDYIEEQTSELETLRCIYSEEELTEVSETPPCFQIQVQSSDDKVSCTYLFEVQVGSIIPWHILVSIDLQFTYTPTYPDAVPEVAVVSYDGLSEQQAEDLEAHISSLVMQHGVLVLLGMHCE